MIWLSRNLFVMPGYYGLCTTPEDFAKAMKHLKIPKKDWPAALAAPQAHATVHSLQNNKTHDLCFIVYMPLEAAKGRTLEECYALLVHEGMHIWQDVVKHINETTPSVEFEAYAVQKIALELMTAWKKATTKPKAKPKKLTSKKR